MTSMQIVNNEEKHEKVFCAVPFETNSDKNKRMFMEAVACGDTQTMDSLAGQYYINADLFLYAAKHAANGDVPLQLVTKCPWDERTFYFAAKGGNLDVMIWLWRNNCPWSHGTFSMAAENGNLENLKWLLEKGCDWGQWTFQFAVWNGNKENMEWFLKNGCLSQLLDLNTVYIDTLVQPSINLV